MWTYDEILRIVQSLMQYGPQDYRKEIYNSALWDLIRALEEERSNEDGRR